jgi:hypothetical protein
MPFEDSAEEILERCRYCVPVNTLAGNAIAAHRIAFASHQCDAADDGARKLADYALRAVIMIATPSADDSRSQLDYLSDLPLNAWEAMDGFCAGWREETLASIVRNMSLS